MKALVSLIEMWTVMFDRNEYAGAVLVDLKVLIL